MWQDRGELKIPQRTQKAPQKSFWTDQISTGGGIGGALAGGAAGALAGSAFTPVGTVIGGLIGSIVGGAAGSGGGEFAENVITGEEDKFKNVGQEALLGGVFSAPPIRGIRALSGAGKALASGAGGQAAKQAAETALTRPGFISQAIGKGGQALTGVGDDLAVKQFRLSPSQTANFKKKFGEDAGKVINKYNFTSPEDIATKGINPLQDQFGQLTRNIGQVSRDDVATAFNSKIATLRKSAVQDNKNLAKQLESQRDTVLQQFGDSGVLDGQSLNAVRREFDSLVNYTQRAADPARYGINKRSADAIREVLQKSDPTGTLKNVGREISKLRQLQEIAVRQGELGRGSLPANLTGLLGAGVAGGISADPLIAAAGFAGTKAINSQAGRRALNQGTESLGNKLSQFGQTPVNPMAALPVAGRQVGAQLISSGVNELQGEGQSSLGINNPMTTSTTQSMNVPMANNMGQSYNNQDQMSTQPTAGSIFERDLQSQQPQSQNPYPRENLIYDIQRDPANADQYIAQYQTLEEIFGGGQAGGELSQTGITAVAGLDNSLQNLDEVERVLNSNRGAFDPIRGRLSSLNPYDQTSAEINQASLVAAQNIGRALEGGKLTDADIARYQAALPGIQDTPEIAQAKINRLRQLINGQRQNYLGLQNNFGGAGIDPSSLEQSLMQQGAF